MGETSLLVVGTEETEEESAHPYYLLSELLLNPELLREPEAIVPRLAWEGRLTLLAAQEKSGKSTLAGQAAAAMVNGQHFLDGPVEQGHVLWYALDEALSDVVRRFRSYGATREVTVGTEPPKPGYGDMEDVIRAMDVKLVVIDSLTELVSGRVKDPYSPTEWTPELKMLRGVLARTGASCLLLHHTRKTGGYADSRQIGAGVDVIIEMNAAAEDSTVRRCSCKGRVKVQDFSLRFIDPWYNLEGAQLPLEMRVYRAIEAAPGMGTTRLRRAVVGTATAIDAATRDLLSKGAIEDLGATGTHAFHVKSLSACDRGSTGVRQGTA